MGKEMNKKQMCASVCLTRIPFFLFMQQATLEVRVGT